MRDAHGRNQCEEIKRFFRKCPNQCLEEKVGDKWTKANQDAADTMTFGGLRGFGDVVTPNWYEHAHAFCF
jgi:hypothetical protein